MELVQTAMDLAVKFFPLLLTVLGAAVLVLAALAPMTASKRDDRLLAMLRKVEGWLVRVVMPFLATKKAAGGEAEKAEVKAAEKAASKAAK